MGSLKGETESAEKERKRLKIESDSHRETGSLFVPFRILLFLPCLLGSLARLGLSLSPAYFASQGTKASGVRGRDSSGSTAILLFFLFLTVLLPIVSRCVSFLR